MGTITTVDVVNGQTTDAGVINSNFAAIKAVVNGSIDNSNISGSANIAVSKLAPAGTNGHILTTVGGIATWAASGGSAADPRTPVGAMVEYPAASAPTGWLLCDGSAVSRTTYSLLFAVCGVTYGSGDGSSTFNLPDRRGRVGVGLSSGGATEVNGLGKSDGRAQNVRNISHRHTITSYDGGGAASPPAHAHPTLPNATTIAVSGDANNTDYPAYLVVNYIIYTGV